MNKVRHIALSTKDPDKTAAFYKEAFGFSEVSRIGPENPGVGVLHGWYLTDGTLNIAVIDFGEQDQLGRGVDYVGLHHFGILCEDAGETTEALGRLGSSRLDYEPGPAATYETKFVGPDGVVFDIAEMPWPGTPTL